MFFTETVSVKLSVRLEVGGFCVNVFVFGGAGIVGGSGVWKSGSAVLSVLFRGKVVIVLESVLRESGSVFSDIIGAAAAVAVCGSIKVILRVRVTVCDTGL